MSCFERSVTRIFSNFCKKDWSNLKMSENTTIPVDQNEIPIQETFVENTESNVQDTQTQPMFMNNGQGTEQPMFAMDVFANQQQITHMEPQMDYGMYQPYQGGMQQQPYIHNEQIQDNQQIDNLPQDSLGQTMQQLQQSMSQMGGHDFMGDQDYFDARSRTVTMDSILNTVTSDASINLADYSKVYSALNPPAKPSRFSMQSFDGLNFPSPPNTPHGGRQFTSHGLSNLNPQSEYHSNSGNNSNSNSNDSHNISNQPHYQHSTLDTYQQEYNYDIPQLFDSRQSNQSTNNYQQGGHVQSLLNPTTNFHSQSFDNSNMNNMSSQQQLQHQQNQQQGRQLHIHPSQTLYTSPSTTGNYNDTETYSYDENNKPVRIYKCPRPLCTKIYKNANGLKYHMENGKHNNIITNP